MAATVNVIQPDEEYQQVNTNNSLISIWKKQGYDVALARTKRTDMNSQYDLLNERLDIIADNINKLKSASQSLAQLKELIAATKEASGRL